DISSRSPRDLFTAEDDNARTLAAAADRSGALRCADTGSQPRRRHQARYHVCRHRPQRLEGRPHGFNAPRGRGGNELSLVRLSSLLIVLLGIPASFLAAPTVEARLAAKVDMCHRPPSNPNSYQTITVAASAVPEHLAKGDLLGACATLCDTLCNDANLCTIDHGVWNASTNHCVCSNTPVVCA